MQICHSVVIAVALPMMTTEFELIPLYGCNDGTEKVYE